MEQKKDKPGRNVWFYLTPLYIALAVLLAKVDIIGKFGGQAFLPGKPTVYMAPAVMRGKRTGYVPVQPSNSASLHYALSDDSSRESAAGYGTAKSGKADTSLPRTQRAKSPQKTQEGEFLREHDTALKQYQANLRDLGLQLREKYPGVKKVDADFANMSRYMALKQQYENDRDAYKWARGVMALPEVRQKMINCMSDPDVMMAGIEMALAVLKNPPPAPIYSEVIRFLTTDRQAVSYVQEMSGHAVENLDSVIPQIATAGLDITPLQDFGAQLTAGGTTSSGKR
ncbi:MAG: hypothetical protein COT18_08720 [Elusimicrobia bacterium CG08_land_8_20_14_0_20_59_10]|nr:MAG: hypothetical protein COT18_08720 [Elusimicrobia bacterium CG08_land_8_20_14_0_20_59_10]